MEAEAHHSLVTSRASRDVSNPEDGGVSGELCAVRLWGCVPWGNIRATGCAFMGGVSLATRRQITPAKLEILTMLN